LVYNKEAAFKALKDIVGPEDIHMDEPMKRHTTFRIGGPADILVTPGREEEISRIYNLCRKSDIPLLVMGNGGNLLVRDEGIRGVVLKLLDNFSKYTVSEDIIEAQAGILLSRLSNIAAESGLTGLEFASGIPGTLGGAITMNAGAYGGEMSQVVQDTRCLDEKGNICTLQGKEHNFGYRKSIFSGTCTILLSSRIKLTKGNAGEIKARMEEYAASRKAKQPLSYPSAGSVFKRPDGYYAGRLIEDAGLKGYTIGGAQVSALHAGFIINLGDASARDVLSLIEYIQTTVREKFGVELEPEVKIVGEG